MPQSERVFEPRGMRDAALSVAAELLDRFANQPPEHSADGSLARTHR